MTRTLTFLALFGLSSTALAQDSRVSIGGSAVRGTATINVSAGTGNAQANAGIIADGPLANTSGVIRQVTDQQSGDSASARAAIAGAAFAGSTGWLAISGAAGNDNQQANIATIAFGTEVGTAGETLLSQSRASTGPTGRPGPSAPAGERSATIGDAAFAGSSGLVQVSLVGGDRNTSANSFALSVTGNAGP